MANPLASRRRAPRYLALVLGLLVLPSLDARPAGGESSQAIPDEPVTLDQAGSGELLWKSPKGFLPLPTVRTDVEIAVTGVMARGTVVQDFSNPTAQVIEAVYVFPLPEGAAVDAMEMRIGDRKIAAVLREKEEARTVFARARHEGKKASLLEQRRPNLFTTSVANINPGETVSVRLEYLEHVYYEDGIFGLAFPLTFTPRYVPGSCSANTSGEPFARHETAQAPRAGVVAKIEAGVPLEWVRSPSHPILVETTGGAARAEVEGGTVVADRDFLLRWKVRLEDRPQGAVFVEDREGGRYALAMLLPPAPESEAGRGLPTETLFVVDVSGSMDGPSIAEARLALLAALGRLRPDDTFSLMKFNEGQEVWSEGFLLADGPALEAAGRWVRGLAAGGGTEILPALVRGMEMMRSGDTARAQRIILVTDGAVANEDEVFADVSRRLGSARLHVVGIGSAPNRHLVRKLVRFGRGASTFVSSPDDVEERMVALFERLERPVMTDLALEWDGAGPAEVYPERLPDLYAGEPLFVSMKLGEGAREIRAVLRGLLEGGEARADLTVAEEAPAGSGVATRWARAKVDALLDSLHGGADSASVRQLVIEVASAFNLVTPYTSLVAVEEIKTAEGQAETLRIASALPLGSFGSRGGETLPQGGTSGPLLLLVGSTLTAAGLGLGLFARLWR